MDKTVTLQNDLIVIRFPYSPALVDLVKTIAGRVWNKEEKFWSLPSSPWHCLQVRDKLGRAGFVVDQSILERAAQATAMRTINAGSVGRDRGELYPYQSACVDFIQVAGGRVVVGDEMGLGKTVETLWWVKEHQDQIKRILVVSPTSVIYKWAKREIPRWLGDDWMVQVIAHGDDRLSVTGRFTHVMSYPIMTKKHVNLAKVGYDLIIWDECHYLKNKNAKRTQAARLIASTVPFIVGLSGTPFLNRPIELFPMLNMLDSSEWPSEKVYGLLYCGGFQHPKGVFMGATKTDELQDRLKTSTMIRRLKADVQDQLPPLTRMQYPVDLTAERMTEYKAVRRQVSEAIKAMDPESKGYFANALDKMNMLRQFVGKAKAELAVEWIENFFKTVESNRKLVIYVHHVNKPPLADYLKEEVEHLGITSTMIVGGVDAETRDNRVTAFQADIGGPRVMVISSAGGEGIDLFGIGRVHCSDILFVEREWTPAKEEQAEGRLDRQGQIHGVQAHYLIVNHTIDEHFDNLIESKRDIFRSVVGQDVKEQTVASSLLDIILKN